MDQTFIVINYTLIIGNKEIKKGIVLLIIQVPADAILADLGNQIIKRLLGEHASQAYGSN